jgi:hypothetical protein
MTIGYEENKHNIAYEVHNSELENI